MAQASRKEIRTLLRQAGELGWTAQEVRCGWLLKHPSGLMTTIHRSGGSDSHNLQNIRAILMRPAKARAA